MIKRVIAAFQIRFMRANHTAPTSTVVADPSIVAKYAVKRMYTFEYDSPEHKLAQESLVFIDQTGDMVTYSDNGIVENAALFEDLCAANRKDINKYYLRRLKRHGLNM